ncbi:hypothetical protein CYMTET_37434 [Cymbomonas tetramitiformis]|uniref:Uncharacterized protein n=1 Tax=Cymbomonas tetramitiformis TaxID=36881 RepID=A0AAE0CE27_9CHLO|nr:hypothetical protein CYMTET_37434 [Cymbomonas tetramitiformis]
MDSEHNSQDLFLDLDRLEEDDEEGDEIESPPLDEELQDLFQRIQQAHQRENCEDEEVGEDEDENEEEDEDEDEDGDEDLDVDEDDDANADEYEDDGEEGEEEEELQEEEAEEDLGSGDQAEGETRGINTREIAQKGDRKLGERVTEDACREGLEGGVLRDAGHIASGVDSSVPHTAPITTEETKRLAYEALATAKRKRPRGRPPKFAQRTPSTPATALSESAELAQSREALDELLDERMRRRKRARGQKRPRKRRKKKDIPEAVARKLGDANLLYASEHYEAAINLCNEVVSMTPNLPDAYHTLGLLHDAIGNPRKATNFYWLAAACTPKDIGMWKYLATWAMPSEVDIGWKYLATWAMPSEAV